MKPKITKLGKKVIETAQNFKEQIEDWEEDKLQQVQMMNYSRQLQKCDNPEIPNDRDEIRRKTLFFISDLRVQRELRSGDPERIRNVYDSMPEDVLDCYLNDETNGCRFCDIEKQGNKSSKLAVYREVKDILDGGQQKPKKTFIDRITGR